MRKWVGLWMALGLSLVGTSVHSANINDLGAFYAGPAASLSNPALEDTLFNFQVTNKSGGNFTGTIEDLQMTIAGKVTGVGKITFSGATDGVFGMQDIDIKIKFKGQLSVTGEVAAGTVDLKGTVNGADVTQKFLTYMSRQDVKKAGGSSGTLGILAR